MPVFVKTTSGINLNIYRLAVYLRLVFFCQNIDYNIQTNNLQSTKINQNNVIKMSQTINITLQPMQ